MQSSRKYPFKIIPMTVTRIGVSKYCYEVFENSKRLTSRIHNQNDFIACLVVKDLNIYPYSIERLCGIIRRLGDDLPSKYPYAIGLKQGVEFPDDDMLKGSSRLGSLFLRR